MKDQRKAKLKELKATVKLATEDLKAYRKEYGEVKLEEEATEEQKTEYETKRKEMAEILGQKGGILEALIEEQKTTKMNKYSSAFFEWTPSGPNRRMRRAAARQR